MSPSVTATWRMLSPKRAILAPWASCQAQAARSHTASWANTLSVLPVADDDLSLQAHARADEPELAPAVGRLVEVHKVHVDRVPGDVAVELGVEVDKGLLQRLQARDPHLGRAKGVHPGDQTDAVLSSIGLHTQIEDLLRCGQDRLENDSGGDGI